MAILEDQGSIDASDPVQIEEKPLLYDGQRLDQPTFHGFALRDGKFELLPKSEDGVYRSEVFPGLWLDEAAFVANDGLGVMAALRLGLQSLEHADFVERLRQNRAKRP
jgi:hypothetical protein